MKLRRLISTVVAMSLGILLLPLAFGETAAGAQAPSAQPSCPAGGQREIPNPSLALQVTTDRQAYLSGAPMTFTLTVTNPSDDRVTVGLGAMLTDFVVRSADRTEIWRWTHGKIFPRILVLCTFAPGETVTFTQQWDQRDNPGRQVPTGADTVAGALVTAGQPHPTSPQYSS